ncbi:MAG: AIR synthase-related protein [Bryobacteraceae bacterium]
MPATCCWGFHRTDCTRTATRWPLARKLLFDVAGYGPDKALPYDAKLTVAGELLKVHASYLRPIRALLDVNILKGAAHITGGGISDNTPRILPKGLAAEVHSASWRVPPIFELLREIGHIPLADFRRTFNLFSTGWTRSTTRLALWWNRHGRA